MFSLERSEQTCHHLDYAYSWQNGWSWPTSVSFNSSPFGVLICVCPRTWTATERQDEWAWSPGWLHACVVSACVVNPLVNTTALARPLAHLAACSAQLLVTRLGPPLHLGSTFDRRDWHTRWQGCLDVAVMPLLLRPHEMRFDSIPALLFIPYVQSFIPCVRLSFYTMRSGLKCTVFPLESELYYIY